MEFFYISNKKNFKWKQFWLGHKYYDKAKQITTFHIEIMAPTQITIWSLSTWNGIVRSISHFSGVSQKNCPVSETGQFFFPLSWISFVQSFLKIGHPLIRDWTKKIKKADKKTFSSLWDWTLFLLADPKNEKLTGQLVGQETDQNHMDVPFLGTLTHFLSTCSSEQEIYWRLKNKGQG